MGPLSSIEAEAVERAGAEPMLAQVEEWAAVNSGSRNLDGLATMAGLLAGAFSKLPGSLTLVDAAPVPQAKVSFSTPRSKVRIRHPADDETKSTFAPSGKDRFQRTSRPRLSQFGSTGRAAHRS